MACTRQMAGVLLGLMLVLAGNLSCSGGSTGAAPAETIERMPLSDRQERQQVVQGSGEVPEVLAVGERPTDAERAEVTELMTRFRARPTTFDLSLLEAYVTAHPTSPYTPPCTSSSGSQPGTWPDTRRPCRFSRRPGRGFARRVHPWHAPRPTVSWPNSR